MALSLILMGTGSISVRQAVRQGLVSSGMVLTVSAVLLDPRHKRLSTRVAGIGILLSSIAIVLFFT
jgi:hypothetical protein